MSLSSRADGQKHWKSFLQICVTTLVIKLDACLGLLEKWSSFNICMKSFWINALILIKDDVCISAEDFLQWQYVATKPHCLMKHHCLTWGKSCLLCKNEGSGHSCQALHRIYLQYSHTHHFIILIASAGWCLHILRG